MLNSDQKEVTYQTYGVMALDWEKEPHDYVRAYDDAEELAFLTRNLLKHERDMIEDNSWEADPEDTIQWEILKIALMKKLQNRASDMLLKELLHGDKIQTEAD